MEGMIENLKKHHDLPLVTVAVPCYNHEKFVVQCIESIIAQTYKNIELIVFDDGSVDGSPDVLRNLSQQYNFKLILQKNQGLPRTINTILKQHTNGKYFSLCASDDYWLPDKIEKQVAFMEANRFYPACYGKNHGVNESSEIIHKYDTHNNKLKGGYVFEDIFLLKVTLPVNFMFRIEIFDELGLYDENVFAEDYEMNLRISHKYPIGFINEYLSFYRLTNVPAKIDRLEIVYNSCLLTIEKYRYHPKFLLAKKRIYLAKFEHFAPYVILKKKAAFNMFKALPLFYRKGFIMSVLRFVLVWKKL